MVYQKLIIFWIRYLPLLRTTRLRKMSFFDAVMSSGMSIPEDLMNQAKNLIQQIGPFVEDQEYLQLICLLQMLKPPRKWMDQVSLRWFRLWEIVKILKYNPWLFNFKYFRIYSQRIFLLLHKRILSIFMKSIGYLFIDVSNGKSKQKIHLPSADTKLMNLGKQLMYQNYLGEEKEKLHKMKISSIVSQAKQLCLILIHQKVIWRS